MKFPEQLPPDFKLPIGRRGRTAARKSYVVVRSDRDPTKEVRVHLSCQTNNTILISLCFAGLLEAKTCNLWM